MISTSPLAPLVEFPGGHEGFCAAIQDAENFIQQAMKSHGFHYELAPALHRRIPMIIPTEAQLLSRRFLGKRGFRIVEGWRSQTETPTSTMPDSLNEVEDPRYWALLDGLSRKDPNAIRKHAYRLIDGRSQILSRISCDALSKDIANDVLLQEVDRTWQTEMRRKGFILENKSELTKKVEQLRGLVPIEQAHDFEVTLALASFDTDAPHVEIRQERMRIHESDFIDKNTKLLTRLRRFLEECDAARYGKFLLLE
jgi:hypothetical protein